MTNKPGKAEMMRFRYTDSEVKEYIEPLISLAEPDTWSHNGYYFYGWKGNPIIAAVLMYKKSTRELHIRLKETQESLEFYKSRYEKLAQSYDQVFGGKKQ